MLINYPYVYINHILHNYKCAAEGKKTIATKYYKNN